MKEKNRNLSAAQSEELIELLKIRFHKNLHRHEGAEWAGLHTKMTGNAGKLWSLNEMEQTGGEPDVVDYNQRTGEYIFCDCSPESPKGRRSLCYDSDALMSRKEHKPADTAMDMAAAMGVEVLTEEEYRMLQKIGKFDLKTSSWIKTPAEIRKLGGALFCDCRYNRVFAYHNGAESYYASRGFRSSLRI